LVWGIMNIPPYSPKYFSSLSARKLVQKGWNSWGQTISPVLEQDSNWLWSYLF
jgi:hypothetical protein